MQSTTNKISITTKKKLQKLLSITGTKEQQLEFARQNLCKVESFEPYASFQRLDRLCKGYLTAKDIIAFLRDNAIDATEEIEAKLVIQYFDSTATGKLVYSDYLQILLPCDQPYLRATATQRPTYPITQKDFLPFDVERALSKLIHKELKLARQQEIIKQEVTARYDYDIEKLFKEIDDWGYKYIDHKNLKRFLNFKMGVPASDQHVIAIIRRFDLDADAKLTLKEFAQGIIPQLDFSKRSVKDRGHKPSVNNRELVLSPGRVPETFAVNKEETINIHHSPLRSRGASARRAMDTNRSNEKEVARKASHKRTASKKKAASSRSKSRPKSSKTKSFVAAPAQSSAVLKKEFHNFKRVMTASSKQGIKAYKTERQAPQDDFDSIVASPEYGGKRAENTPLRNKNVSTTTPVKHKSNIQNQSNIKPALNQQTQQLLANSYISPKSQSGNSYSNFHQHVKSETSPYSAAKNELSQIRAMRSPYSNEMQRAEEGDASLIFLTRDAFKEILAIEGHLEVVKKELAIRHDFSLAGVFRKFCDNTHGRINATELLYGLERIGITCDIADARLIIDRYDADKDGRLGFWELSNAFLPIQAGLRDEIEMRKSSSNDFSPETQELLLKTLRCIVDTESMIEGIRQRISREKAMHLRYAFDSLDWLGRGFLTQNEFKRAFESISERLGSPQLHQEIVVRIRDSIEMEGMIRRFNKDKLNGRISLPEFLDELSPKCSEKPY